MQINSSSVTLPPSPLVCSVNKSLYPTIFSCFDDSRNTINYIVYTLHYLLFILPLCILVLWMGFRQPGSRRPATGQTNNADVFTYCMAVMDILNVFGQASYCCAIFVCNSTVMVLGYYCICFAESFETFFHFLTCVERYLAVVHPILYMRLKRSHGVRIRNVTIACAWLLIFVGFGFVVWYYPSFPVVMYVSVFSLVVMTVCYCSLAVFCVLIRSGMRSDQSKWRAFYTIIAITGALLLRFTGQVLSMSILNSMTGNKSSDCDIFMFGCWMCIPSSLVLPLLFLHRNEKLACLNRNLKKNQT